jgi:cobalamin-dependent methionine synthase I
MIIIGERINSTRPKVNEAIKNRNISFIVKEAKAQAAAGADYIDVNCAMTSGDELQDMDWVISVIQSEMKDASVCIDSPSYLAIERALKTYKGKGAILINSITGEGERMKMILPLARQHNARLVALTMDRTGIPTTAEGRVRIAADILERVKKEGIEEENLYFDPLIQPISTEPAQAYEFLKSIPLIKKLGKVSTICGISNVSFGLPNRRLVNSTFLTMAIHAGLDAAILDPLDTLVMSSVAAAKALLCEDEYCSGYISAFRQGKLI